MDEILNIVLGVAIVLLLIFCIANGWWRLPK